MLQEVEQSMLAVPSLPGAVANQHTLRGSASPFVGPIAHVGLSEQDAPRRIFKITEPIMVEQDDAMLAAFPCTAAPGNSGNSGTGNTGGDQFQLIFDLDYGPNSHRIKRQ